MARRKRTPPKDSVSTVGKDGRPTNAFLYDVVDGVPETKKERQAYKAQLIALGLSEGRRTR